MPKAEWIIIPIKNFLKPTLPAAGRYPQGRAIAIFRRFYTQPSWARALTEKVKKRNSVIWIPALAGMTFHRKTRSIARLNGRAGIGEFFSIKRMYGSK